MKTITKQPEVKNYINGKFDRNGQKSMDVLSPSDGSKISTLPMSTTDDVNAAVHAAKKAFPAWSNMTLKERVQIFFRYRSLLEKNMEELTELVKLENGKTFGEAKAEVEKSMELYEQGIKLSEDLEKKLDTYKSKIEVLDIKENKQ